MSLNSSFITFILGLGIGALALSPIILFRQKSNQKLDLFTPHATQEAEEVVKEIINKNGTVAQTLIKQLHEQHQQNLKNLQEAFPFSKQEWDELWETLAFIKKEDAQYNPAKPATESTDPWILKAQALLKKCGINPEKVTISLVNNIGKAMNASAGQGYADGHILHLIEMNIPRFSQLDPDTQEATLKHEIMHLINCDPLERALICNLLEKHGLIAEEYESSPAFRAYYHHTEFRADLMASSDDIAIGRGLQKNCMEYLHKYPEKQNKNSHPSDLQRYYALARLISYLEAENRLKSVQPVTA